MKKSIIWNLLFLIGLSLFIQSMPICAMDEADSSTVALYTGALVGGYVALRVIENTARWYYLKGKGKEPRQELTSSCEKDAKKIEALEGRQKKIEVKTTQYHLLYKNRFEQLASELGPHFQISNEEKESGQDDEEEIKPLFMQVNYLTKQLDSQKKEHNRLRQNDERLKKLFQQSDELVARNNELKEQIEKIQSELDEALQQQKKRKKWSSTRGEKIELSESDSSNDTSEDHSDEGIKQLREMEQAVEAIRYVDGESDNSSTEYLDSSSQDSDEHNEILFYEEKKKDPRIISSD